MFNKQNFDTTIKPQDDFYRFVNGGWLENNPIPSYESRWGTFLKLREDNWKRLHVVLEELVAKSDLDPASLDAKLRNFYISAIDPIKPELPGSKFINKWLSKINAAATISDMLSVVYELQGYDISVPWAHMVDIDERNSEQYIFRLHQAGLGMPDRDYYFKDDDAMQKIRTEYALHIPRMMALVDSGATSDIAANVMVIERALAEASMTSTERRDIESQYNKRTFAELQAMVPEVDWQVYFKTINCAVPQELLIDQLTFMEAVSTLLKEQTVDVWKDYLRWHVVRSAANYMGESFEEQQFLFYGKVLAGTESLQPRWKRVVMQMDGAIGEALGQKFVERHFPQKAKERMAVLVQDLKDAFAARIQKLTWMSSESKIYAQKKLAGLRLKIGHPDTWRDYTAMQVGDECYLANMLEASRFEIQRNFNRLGGPVDTEEWFMTPQTVNAYALFNLNEIVFPAGILQPPFFDFEADNAENYGAIGSVIGHEITHGFDDKGSQFDAEGNMRNWRTDEDRVNFEKLAHVLEEQANNYQVLPDLKLNGKLTLGENIADVGGIEIALDAFERSLSRESLPDVDGFTPVQRFFLSHARSESENERDEKLRNRVLTDPHSPAEFRSNGVVKNVDRFYEAFYVKPEDGMYIAPDTRVKIW